MLTVWGSWPPSLAKGACFGGIHVVSDSRDSAADRRRPWREKLHSSTRIDPNRRGPPNPGSGMSQCLTSDQSARGLPAWVFCLTRKGTSAPPSASILRRVTCNRVPHEDGMTVPWTTAGKHYDVLCGKVGTGYPSSKKLGWSEPLKTVETINKFFS